MKVCNREWDVRCPETLKELFPERVGYYYRVNQDTAEKVLKILSDAYQIPAPKIAKVKNGSREYGKYIYTSETIMLHSWSHLKTVFHEFYHHLDNMTNGMYNSDDREGGPTSLSWIFADKLWAKFRLQTNHPKSRTRRNKDKNPAMLRN